MSLLTTIKKCIPADLYHKLQPAYHYCLALASACFYRFPARSLTVIGITGTKGKSSTSELIAAILEEAGKTVALSGTIHFKIAGKTEENKYKMSMPGRGFIQHFLRRAVRAKCTHAVIEMTSEGSRFFRHRFTQPKAIVVTNLTPEHIESHGSFEAYREAKVDIARELTRGCKRDTWLVVNGDDTALMPFLDVAATHKEKFFLSDAEPYTLKARGIDFTWSGHTLSSPLTGAFNLQNILAAATVCHELGIDDAAIVRAIEACGDIKGRVERIQEGQPFDVIVDYAHTADSLRALYSAFPNTHIVGVLGNTGGGRDAWKRAEMAKVAETFCQEIILTNEDPYDEDPDSIVATMEHAITTKKPRIIMDRRAAIHEAIVLAYQHFRSSGEPTAVLITGKGTDPYIMGPNGTKTPWSDSAVAAEELKNVFATPTPDAEQAA